MSALDRTFLTLVTVLLGREALGCSSSGTPPVHDAAVDAPVGHHDASVRDAAETGTLCVPGKSSPCSCEAGGNGEKTCAAAGKGYGSCTGCGRADAGRDASLPPAPEAGPCVGDACTPTCASGECTLTLASGTGLAVNGGTVGAVAVDTTHVYWVGFDVNQPSSGVLAKVPINGGPITALAAGLAQPTAVAVDRENVYWSDSQLGTVMKLPLAGGKPTTLFSGPGVSAIAIDATFVYWTSGLLALSGPGSVMRVPIAGGAASTLAGGLDTPDAIAVDATHVYWANRGVTGQPTSGSVVSLPLAGGAIVTLASTQLEPFAIAIDSTNVYWATGAGVALVPKAGGSPMTLATAAVSAMAVDGVDVYWAVSASMTGGDGVVAKVPNAGGTTTTLASALGSIAALAVDPTSVYFGASGANGPELAKLTPK